MQERLDRVKAATDTPALTRAGWDAKRATLSRALGPGKRDPTRLVTEAITTPFGPRPADPLSESAVSAACYRGRLDIRVFTVTVVGRFDLHAGQVRDMAAALTRAADWLDARDPDEVA